MEYSYRITLLIISIIISTFPAHAVNDTVERLQKFIEVTISEHTGNKGGAEKQDAKENAEKNLKGSDTEENAERQGAKDEEEEVVEVIAEGPKKPGIVEENLKKSDTSEDVEGISENPEKSDGVEEGVKDIEKQLIKDSKKKKREKYCSSTRAAKIFCLAWLFFGTSVTIPLDVIALNESKAMIETSSPRTAFVGNGTLPYEAGCLYSTYNGTAAPACTKGECPRIEGYHTCMLKECGERFTIDQYLKECEKTHFALKAAIAIKAVVSAGVAMTMGAVLGCR